MLNPQNGFSMQILRFLAQNMKHLFGLETRENRFLQRPISSNEDFVSRYCNLLQLEQFIFLSVISKRNPQALKTIQDQKCK